MRELLKIQNIEFHQSGFTLIETIIYSGLLAIIMSTVLPAVSVIIKSFGQVESTTQFQTETFFITSKIDFLLKGATNIEVENYGNAIVISNHNFSNSDNPVKLSFQEGGLKIKRGVDGLENSLTSKNIVVVKTEKDIFALETDDTTKLKINLNLSMKNNIANLSLVRVLLLE